MAQSPWVGPLGYYLAFYRSSTTSRWKAEGLDVSSYDWLWNGTTKADVLAHMGNPDLYRYAIIAHGENGVLESIAPNPFVDEDGNVRTSIFPRKYTGYGIAEMQLISCDTNTRAYTWATNVSVNGVLRTVKGKRLFLFEGTFVDQPGSAN